MKHFTQTTANGLHTPPCGSSHGKSTRFFILTLLLGLLTLGSTSAWGADYYIAHGDGWNTNSNWGFNEGMTKVGDVYYYKLAGRAQNSKIQFKIRPSDDDSGWNKHLYQNANADTQNRGNITLLGEQEGSDTKKRFAYTPTTSGGEDIYIYTDGTSVWANAVPAGSSLSGKTIRLQGDLWTGTDSYGWGIATQSPTLEIAPSGEYASTAFYLPVPTTEGADKYVQARFEIIVNGNKDSNLSISVNGATNASTDNAKTIAKVQGNQSSRVKYVQVRYYANHQAITTISDAPAMTGNWYLYIDKVLKGQFVNGQLIVNDLPADNGGGYHSIYVAQRDDLANVGKEIKTSYPQGIAWLGGLYIDTENSSSGISWKKGYYGDNAKFSNLPTFPLINGTTGGQSNSPSEDERKNRLDARGGFKLPSTGNTLFSLNNGIITIKKQGDYTSAVTFTDQSYLFFNKAQDGNGNYPQDNAHCYFYVWNANTSAYAYSDEAFYWDTNILIAKMPAGNWTHCILFRRSTAEKNIDGCWNKTGDIQLEEGKNYLISTEATTWQNYTPRFYIASENGAISGGGNWNWNGNGTLHEGSFTKELSAGTYKFKVTPYVNSSGSTNTGWGTELNTDHFNSTISNVSCWNGNNREIWFTLTETKDVTIAVSENGVTVNAEDPATPAPDPVTYDGSEIFYFHKNSSGFDWNIWANDCALYLQFSNSDGSSTARSTKVGYFWDTDNTSGNVLATRVPAGTWTKVRVIRTRNEERNTVWNEGTYATLEEEKNYLNNSNTMAVYEPRTFHFYISGSTALANTGSDFNAWNGNGTAHSGSMTKTLNAGTYKFKLNPTGTVDWRSEFNWNDIDAANSSNNINLRKNPANDNTEIWFDLSRKSDVTIACNGSKVTVNATPYYNVTFNSDGGSDVASQSVLSGGTASQPSDPTKAGGYTFNGWKLNDAAYNFSTAVTSDIELVADWTAPTLHTVTFNTDGGSTIDPVEVADGSKVSQPAAPTKSGYNFVKWQLSGVDYNFENAVTDDIELVAVWDAKTLTGISLDQTNIVMVLGGDAVTLTPSYAPADLIPAQRPIYEWSVAPAGVVNVSNAGVVSVVAEGTATVTCTAHGTDKSANCVVTVKDCNTVPTDIFAYTLGSDPTGDAAGSAVMNGMFDEADNTEEETVKRAKISLKDNDGNNLAALVDDNGKVKADNSVDDGSEYWYMIPAGTKAGYDLFYLKNAETNAYIYADQSTDYGQNGDWKYYAARTTETLNDADNFKWLKWINEGQGDKRYIIASAINFDANSNNGNIRGLYRTNVGAETWLDPYIKVGKQANNGYNHARNGMVPTMVEATVDNPAYMHSPVSGYYRFATGASVVATLNRAIKVNDVIRLEVKNPSEAAVSATVTIGSQVENINLVAGATSTETITVTDASRPTSITIASDDVNFMLKSVAVNREMPNPAKNPNLAWSATPSAARQVADGDISSYIATRLGTGLITYTSSDESIATVAANGTVHPIAEGTVTITATLEQDGCYDDGSINYSLTLVDLPKPTITITANEEMPQGSYQTVTVAQNGDGALTFEITSGTGATLTDNGNGTYRLALAGNATDIVLTASTERTEQKAQHSVSKNISVQQCYVDGHVIYEYELTGHADATDVVATGGTYSQANLASVGTTDNPKTVTIVKLKFCKENNGRIFAVDNAGTVNVENDGSPDKAQWLLIPAGENIHPTWANSNCAVYYLKNKATGKYLYRSESATSGDWGYATIGTSTTNASTDYYKWFFYNNGKEHIFAKVGIANDLAHSFRLNSSNQFNTCYSSDKTLLFCGSMTDDNAYSGIYIDQGEMNVGSATNPDYFYSVENENHTYYILKGGSVTVSRASAFKAGDVITLNVFNRGEAASSIIKVAENTIADNVNGAAELTYTVVAEDGIEGLYSFVITPLNEYICLNSISIFRPKDESEFINPTLTWDADLSDQQIINMNNSETGMSHAVSVNAPVNAAVVYSVSPADKANINSATGALTLTGEALNKDVLTVTATLPSIGCYNQAQAAYEIYVKNLATPTLSAAFGTLQQGFASTLTVTTNSDAVPALSNINGFAVNGDPSHEGDNYIYNIVVNNTVESASVHVALSETSDYLVAATDAAGSVTTSSLEDLYENTPEGGTLVLDANYNEGLVINKAITINGGGHSIGNLKVENEGDLTLSSALTVADFTICAKAGNTTTPAASGQVRNASNLTVDGEAYFLYTVDPSGQVQYGWYDFTVPFPVNVMTGIKGIQEGVLKENFVNETDYAIMEHLGDKQAAGQYAYKKFRGIMQPCRLYSITLDDDYNYNTIRFQKTNDGAIAAGNEVTLNAYAGEAKHANWNGVGNGTLHHADAGLSVATIQVYQSGTKTFLPVDRTQYSLVIGSAFMVQQAGTMTLNQATHDNLLAPKREESHQLSAISIQIAREGKPFSDQLFISADETAGQGYNQGVDVAKAGNIGNVNVPQIWTNAYNSKLCAHEAQLINGEAQYALSLYAPANGSYTLTSTSIPAGTTLYLTQNDHIIWDMSENYTFDLNKGTTTEYGLLLVQSHKIPTGIENGEWTNDEGRKVLHNGILYILHNGKVFNAQGAVIK